MKFRKRLERIAQRLRAEIDDPDDAARLQERKAFLLAVVRWKLEQLKSEETIEPIGAVQGAAENG
jgi:hypothetical protein